MGIYVANKVGRQEDNAEARALSVSELSADQYNAPLVDENGVAFTITAAEGNVLASSTVTTAEVNKLDDSVANVWANSIMLPRVALVGWDFAVDGGDIGAAGLGQAIPANSIIVGGVLDVQTTLTSATDAATIALQVASADDIVAAVAIGTGTPWDQGLQVIIPKWTAATMVKTVAEASIVMATAVEALTAGKFTLALFYIPTIANPA